MTARMALLALLSLAGCGNVGAGWHDLAHPEERWAAQDDAKCRSYGSQAGSPAYVQCRAQLDAARTQAGAIESIPSR